MIIFPMPEENKKSLNLLKLIPVKMLQRIQDNFCNALSITADIIDLECNPLTRVSRRTKFCDGYMHVTPKFDTLCKRDNKEAVKKVLETGKPYIFRCHAGFCLFSIPITVQGRIIACIQSGRVRLENPDVDASKEKAKYLEVSLEDYLEVYWSLPYFTEKRLDAAVEFLKVIANTISSLAIDRLSEKKRADKMRYLNEILEKEIEKRTKELRESEARFKALIENAADVIYTVNGEGILTSINKAAEDFFGYKQREIVGRHFTKFLYEDDIKKVRDSFLAIKNGERDRTSGLRFRVKTKKGELVYVELNSRAHFDRKGRFECIEGLLRDITEKVRLERRVKQTTDRYKAIFKSIREGAYIVDMDGVILSVNDALLKMFGCKKEEDIVGKKARDFYVHPADRRVLEEKIEKEGRVENFIAHAKKIDGTKFYIEIDTGVIKNDNGDLIGIEGVIRDVTEKISLEKELQRCKAGRKSRGMKKKVVGITTKAKSK